MSGKHLTKDTVKVIDELNKLAEALHKRMLATGIQNREMSLAITNLEQAMMWGVKGVILSQKLPS